MTRTSDDVGNDAGPDLSLDLEDVVLTRSYWTDAGLVEPPWHTQSKWTLGEPTGPGEMERATYFLCLRMKISNTGDEDIDLGGQRLAYAIGDYLYIDVFNRPMVLNRSEDDPRYVSDTPVAHDLLLSPSDSITGWFITSLNETMARRDSITIDLTLMENSPVFPSPEGIGFPSLEVDLRSARVYDSIRPRLSMGIVEYSYNDTLDGYQPSPGNRFIVVDLVLRTEWEFDMMVKADNLQLVDDGDETYNVSKASETLPDYGDHRWFGSSRELTMSLVFELPMAAEPVLLVLDDDVSVEAEF